MKKQIEIIHENVFSSADINHKTLDQLCTMFNKIRSEYGNESVVRYNDYMFNVIFYRLETDEEYTDRKKKNERSKELRMEREIKEIKRLENKWKKLKQKCSTRK